MSLTPTVSATDPTQANSPILHQKTSRCLPLLPICSSTSFTSSSTGKWVFTMAHTHTQHPDIATQRLKRPRGPIKWERNFFSPKVAQAKSTFPFFLVRMTSKSILFVLLLCFIWYYLSKGSALLKVVSGPRQYSSPRPWLETLAKYSSSRSQAAGAGGN